MLNKTLGLVITLGMLCWSATAHAQQDDLAQARTSAAALGKALMTELTSAMQQNGPLAAIDVCHLQALPIAEQISQMQGWQVARTSTKVRNPQNKADAWELEQLAAFEKKLRDGTPIDQLDVLSTHQQDGKIVQRYMKAIGIQPGCLACHGSKLSPDVAAKLDALYPQDQAKGYDVGQLRGAFTLQRDLKH